ncbi:MAG TPA: sodium-dependent bicarbonate transport family permease [Xanthomonadales bacterium]|nr:sodium-dependent bicarbonate transport family permease [Xanthomonadales bacterium]
MPISTELLTTNLTSPVVLAFGLGLVARLLRSDLAFPSAIQQYLSIFLLLAIGLKGGVALGQPALAELALYIAATIVIGVVTTGSAYLAARLWLRQPVIEAASLAAHYGSVSAVTFIAAQQFSERLGQPADAVLVALVVALELPALLVGLTLGRRAGGSGGASSLGHTTREVLTSKTFILLLGGLAIGAISGRSGVAAVEAMYFQLFQGMLMLFMLDMGLTAAERLRELREGVGRLLAFAVVVPLGHGLLGALVATAIGLNPSSAAVFAAMTASASYIAAPAAVRAGLPEANVGRAITASLGITFPFNLAIGIPLYAAFTDWLAA